MLRKIIHINSQKCNGCGKCADACHESAIGIVNGKAKLIREDFCDGLGDCLPKCPTGAIRFEIRDVPPYDEAAVEQNKAAKKSHGGCPGTRTQRIQPTPPVDTALGALHPSQLQQWPCQIKLVPHKAAFFENADLLLAADCTAFAYADFHRDFMQGKITLIGCPKLDQIDYSEKLEEIFCQNTIRSITVLRMEVPCCGALEAAAKKALAHSSKTVPIKVFTLTINGKRKD